MLAEAQGNITGRVIDEQSQPIPFVKVVLLNRADSAFIMGTVTKDDAFEVFGKGAPLIYINGRLMRDASELDQLKSENIKSVARHYNLALGQSL